MADLDAIFNHIVLPPTLPFSRDADHFAVGKGLLQRLVEACGVLQSVTPNTHTTACNELVTALGVWSSVYGEHVDKKRYHTALQSVTASNKHVLALHIVEQNAALLVYGLDEHVVFEAFEASSQSQDVLATPNALVWKFPSQAAQIPKAQLVQDEGLQHALAAFLSKATSEHLSQFSASGQKAGIAVSESRNPGSPALIMNMLLAVIEALGSPAKVHVLKKRVRDDVVFRSGPGGTDPGCGPWRRHPFWLLLRVAVRRHLQLAFGVAAGHVAYKLLLSMVTANLLRDTIIQRKPVTTVDLVLKKLCRRLAKIEQLPKAGGAPCSLDSARALFEQAVRSANDYIQAEFNTFKKTSTRWVPRLPPRLDPDHESLRLSLPNSTSFLQELSRRYSHTQLPVRSSSQSTDLDGMLRDNPGILQARGTYNKVSSLLLQLARAMDDASDIMAEEHGDGDTLHGLCQRMSDILDGLLSSLPPLSSDDPQLNSQICLTVFRVWVHLDKLATAAFPMLLDYRPLFPPDLLNVLQLTRLSDMEHARKLQVYLRVRHENATCRDRSIFSTLDQGCFGARFTESSPPLMACLNAIREAEREHRAAKRIEWEAACDRYTALAADIESTPCKCTIDEDGEPVRRDCEHHFLKRELWRLRIAVCEDLLPADNNLAAAVVFELDMPAALSAYRSTTWALLRQLAYPVCHSVPVKVKTLADNRALAEVLPTAAIFTNTARFSVCLASPNKAFRQTHYQDVQMWTEYEELLVPHGSIYSIYDTEARTQTSRFDWPLTLAHLCGISIPSPLAHVFPRLAHPPTHPEGPSSYQAVANRLKCPEDVALHEFEAFHHLLAGRARRWLTLLAELGSSNLNCSKDDTLLTCTHLVKQVGPETRDTSSGHGWILGTCHAVFADDCFVDCLLGEIQTKLDATRGSWRETNTMDLIMTLSLAVYMRATSIDHQQKAYDIVRSVRATVLQWIESLRKEGGTSSAASSSASKYSFRAALLGRRTFTLFALATSEAGRSGINHSGMGPGDVTEYLTLSIALQQNRVVDMDRLSRIDKMMLRRDAAFATELQTLIMEAATQYPEAVGEAVAHGIGIGTGTIKSFVAQQVHRDRHSGWMTAVISTASGHQQVDLDCLGGHILVDGKTLRKLPDDIRDSADVQELFGQQHLLTYPSHIPGAVCRLAAPVEGFAVHFGRHNGATVIMAEAPNKSLSYFVPRRVFMDGKKEQYDLPRGLVDDCVHWYDRQTGDIEISRKPDIWRSKQGNWKIHVATQQAWRNDSFLVDPHSRTCKTVAAIFDNFEDARRLTVFQPVNVKRETGKTPTLKIELRHLDLSFSVSAGGRLVCHELGAEIDSDQDAGTLYGYESMIVMRELGDHGRRSIIAPLGPLVFRPRGVHISLRTDIGNGRARRADNYEVSAQDKAYVRFSIDPVLGRLVCPPDPRLLYTNAQLHAFSSFPPLPDPLTGRTGEEEATAVLQSGMCQPWKPLGGKSTLIMQQIRRLCPQRTFYPTDKRVLQQVSWDPMLPVGIQHDRYGHLVDRILRQSHALIPFQGGVQDQPDGTATTDVNKAVIGKRHSEPADDGTAYLHARAECQRLRFEPPLSRNGSPQNLNVNDIMYKSRARSAQFKVASVQEVALALYRENTVSVPHALSVVLERWKRIGGYLARYQSIEEMSLAELMSVDTISERWGSLVRLCTEAQQPGQTGSVLMALSVMAFSPVIDMDAIRWLLAFFTSTALRQVPFPQPDLFTRFQRNEVPTQEYMESLVAQAYPAFAYQKQAQLWDDARWDVERERDKHWSTCQREGSILARWIVLQWPDDLEDMRLTQSTSSNLLDTCLVLEKVRPEWERLQHNWQLSCYAEEVSDIMHRKGLSRRLCPIVMAQAATCASEYNTGGNGDGCLGRHEKTPRSVAPRLDELVQRDMDWTPLAPRALHPKPMRSPWILATSRIVYRPAGDVVDLGRLIGQFLRFSERTGNELRWHYSSDLKRSLEALKMLQLRNLQQWQSPSNVDNTLPSVGQAAQHEMQAEQTVANLYEGIRRSSNARDTGSWLRKARLWARLTPTTILELLRSTTPPASWGRHVRERLVEYGCALTALQQTRRLQRAIAKGDTRRAWDEVRNCGHTNWQPIDHTDWLLLEVDSDMLIRAQQVDVARALLAPASQANAVLQLNMGQGKTSCIVPMAMAALADGDQLARLIVPKALLPPTAQIVQARLGGLVGRQVRHLAFSRRLLSRSDIDSVVTMYENHHSDLLQRRGILLAAPEHLLSFKLCGLQCLADCHESPESRDSQAYQTGKTSRARREQSQARLRLAQRMLALQDRVANELCRDVLDESDVILAARTQLVYPSGAQTTVDGAPQRWVLTQALLAVVEDQLPRLCQRFPQSINSAPRGADNNGGRGFPVVQILQSDQIQEPLHAAILESLSGGQATSFGTWAPGAAGLTATKKQQMVLDALATHSNTAAIEAAAGLFANPRAARDGLLLVHGLLSHRILLVCLRKRWNVQYGLHPKRSPIAVPYEAKGVPSDRSEFGHPDVAILLTCLAFYYSGLTREQLRSSLRHILCQHDDPVSAYGQWIAGGIALLPAELQQWNVVNPDDETQVDQLWSFLRLTRPVVDHYLNTFVFPAHARQFSVKLQASAWDVPLGKRKTIEISKRASATASKVRTTGFSGTNDNRAMLPLTVQQLDIDSLTHTNAEVLTYLLQDRNREYQCCMNGQGRWTEDALLQNLKMNKIRVLIDAGAYVLERDNRSLARAWLTTDGEAEAAIFFGEQDNRAWVLFRDATAGCLPLVATPFVDERRLERCLVYFDEAHTRGVDLSLPPHTRGGITLALGQTKYHTIQAAMRLRQLGTTQAVLWYAPPEVDRSIRHVWHSITGQPIPSLMTTVTKATKDAKASKATLQSKHVLLWLLEQTCAANEQLYPLYLSQGYDFCQRSAAEKRYRRYTRPEDDIQVYKDGHDDVSEEATADTNDNINGKKNGEGIDKDHVYMDAWCREAVESNRKVRQRLVDTLQQPERMTLDQLYGPSKERASDEKQQQQEEDVACPLIKPKPTSGLSGLAGLFQQLQDKGFDRSHSQISRLTTAAFEEVEQEREQEREVEFQVEQVRAQTTRVHFAALYFPGHLHWAIESFLHSGGTLPPRHGMRHAFSSMARSEIGRRHGVSGAGATSALYVSIEFERTIQPNSANMADAKGREKAKAKRKEEEKEKDTSQSESVSVVPSHDQFYRPVQWLLWSRLTNTAIVVVPEEAELLLSRLRREGNQPEHQQEIQQTAHVHLLLYSAAVTRAMVGLSSGTYYAVPSLPIDYSLPSWLTIETGILGGRLYMPFSECEAMRAYLKEVSAPPQDANGTDKTGNTTSRSLVCPNLSSFLLDWLPLRRTGQDIAHTPAAYVCQGRPLHPDHAFFARSDLN
ncbi:hypothetical protein F503_06573 [Ophiostoma piceae UAMH 11346]|uniref:ubiquitinyl hydrolase 1 n=1 Tax=Ophiostoma piceae (strain UAMH 11346) TaxID=1262450 RepID=S3BQF2_OPHP1|nr:hypothetical protein F503_06573 [Ophiostoma piceae UAMH 11346]